MARQRASIEPCAAVPRSCARRLEPGDSSLILARLPRYSEFPSGFGAAWPWLLARLYLLLGIMMHGTSTAPAELPVTLVCQLVNGFALLLPVIL